MSSERKSHGTGDALSEYLHVMQPRTKKGPSWKDEGPAVTPVASSSVANVGSSAKTVEKPMKGESTALVTKPRDVSPQHVSDKDWLQKHMKANLDEVETNKAYEQSDDEHMYDSNGRHDQNEVSHRISFCV